MTISRNNCVVKRSKQPPNNYVVLHSIFPVHPFVALLYILIIVVHSIMLLMILFYGSHKQNNNFSYAIQFIVRYKSILTW